MSTGLAAVVAMTVTVVVTLASTTAAGARTRVMPSGEAANSAATTHTVTAASCSADASADVVVYGGTAGGVIAAVSAARWLAARDVPRDKSDTLASTGSVGSASSVSPASVLLVSPSAHLGGMVSSGLGWTDGQPSGGIAAEFFARAGGLHVTPGAAEAVFDAMAANASVVVVRSCQVDSASVTKSVAGGSSDSSRRTLASFTTTGGGVVTARVFIDASYEGDLLARAGVAFTVGRESNDTYGESAAGVLSMPPEWSCACNWDLGKVNGTDAAGNLLPMIQGHARDAGEPGSGDDKVQAYNFRLCMTKVPSNRVPVPVPSSYDPADWELLRRGVLAAKPQALSDFLIVNELADGKTDINNGGGLSTDMVGGSWTWPNATYAERGYIFAAHRDYTQSLLHFLRSDSSVPAALQADVAEWGLCADEFVDSGNWPHQLYVREARRMLGDWVFTQRDRVSDTRKNDSIAVGDYNIDGHMAQRVVLSDGSVTNEGCLSGWARYTHTKLGSFEIPYRVMLPRAADAGNLLVPVAVSASHVGSGPLRLEPQYMNMGEAAGVAAGMVATRAAATVQQVDVGNLQAALVAQGVRLHA